MTPNLLKPATPAAPDFSKYAPSATPAAPVPATPVVAAPITKPIAVSSLTAPTAPYVAPPVTPPSQTATGITGAADAATEAHTALSDKIAANVKAAQKTADTSTTDLKATMEQILGVQKSRQGVEDSLHVDELGKMNNDAFTALQASKRSQEKEILAATQAAGGTTAGASEAVAAINRKYAFEQADLSIALDVSNRNYLAASQTADKKIAMQLEPLQTLLGFQTTFYNKNQDKLNETQKSQLELLIADNTRQYEEQRTAAKTLSDTKLSAMQTAQENGAPASVLNAISLATSPEAALRAAGQFGVSIQSQLQHAQLDQIPLDNEYKRAQIANIRSETATRNAALNDLDNGVLTDAQIKTIDNSPQGKKVTTLGDLRQKLSNYQSLIDTYGTASVGSQKAELESAYNELKIAYKTAADLGAIQAPDVPVIEGALKSATFANPLSQFWSKVTGAGLGTVKAGLNQAMQTLNSSAAVNITQLYARNPKYRDSEYVSSLIDPLTTAASSEQVIDTATSGQILRMPDGTLVQKLKDGTFKEI